jgi:FAD/FMN-containing dehydrogenase
MRLWQRITGEYAPVPIPLLAINCSCRSQTAWGSPTCIVTPGSASQLALLVNVLVVNHVQFAIRSGGHSPNPGFANINNGVLIDMSLFNQVHYDASHNVALVGSGLTWGTVYTTLEQYNVTVVGGRVLDVGVGGLMLGGM